jgi:DNA-binding MarR family transcriptional regulator
VANYSLWKQSLRVIEEVSMVERHQCPHDEDPTPPEGIDQESYRVFRSFIRVMHLHRQLMMKAVQSGSPLGHAGALRLVAANDGISQRDLAEKLHLSRPTVTGMLQAMEKAGAIERRTDDKDQRLTRVYLTAEGRALSDRLRTSLASFVNETIGGIPQPDRTRLGELLDQLGDNTERALTRAAHGPNSDETEEKTA